MPFKSKAQQGYLESKDSPLSEAQKREWEGSTDFKKLPERTRHPVVMRPRGRKRAASVVVRGRR